jgi:hypothetical protein
MPLLYSVAQTDVTDAKIIIKSKCQGLFCDIICLSDWPQSDITIIREQMLRTETWSQLRYLDFGMQNNMGTKYFPSLLPIPS